MKTIYSLLSPSTHCYIVNTQCLIYEGKGVDNKGKNGWNEIRDINRDK